MQPTAGLFLSFSFFLILFLGIGAFAARRSAGTERDYLLGGRNFGRWMVGLSAGATGNTTFILIAVVGIGYTQGFGVIAMIVGFALGEFVFWTFFAKPIAEATQETGAETVAELVTHRLPSRSAQKVRSVVSLLIFIFIGGYLAAQLAGSATILNVFFGLGTTAGVDRAVLDSRVLHDGWAACIDLDGHCTGDHHAGDDCQRNARGAMGYWWPCGITERFARG